MSSNPWLIYYINLFVVLISTVTLTNLGPGYQLQLPSGSSEKESRLSAFSLFDALCVSCILEQVSQHRPDWRADYKKIWREEHKFHIWKGQMLTVGFCASFVLLFNYYRCLDIRGQMYRRCLRTIKVVFKMITQSVKLALYTVCTKCHSKTLL